MDFKDFDKLTIADFEQNLQFFHEAGLDISAYMASRTSELGPGFIKGFRDNRGEFFVNAHQMHIGNESVYKKNAYAAEISADVLLGYVYNLIGIPSCIAYPFYIAPHYVESAKGSHVIIPDGVISKDVNQVFGNLEFRDDAQANTFWGLFNDNNCLQTISSDGRLAKILETVACIAYNNKDAGGINTFWGKNPNSNTLDYIVSIDHGYSGRDSMFGSPEQVKHWLYAPCEHGYNGMYKYEEDRATTIYYLQHLLNGEKIDGVQLTDKEIKEINKLVSGIAKLDFKEVSKYINDKFGYKVYSKLIDSLEISREDLVKQL